MVWSTCGCGSIDVDHDTSNAAVGENAKDPSHITVYSLSLTFPLCKLYRLFQAVLYKLLVWKTLLHVKQPDAVQSRYVHTSADHRQSDDRLCSGWFSLAH